MPKSVLIDEFQLGLYTTARRSDPQVVAARQILDNRRFQAALARAIKSCLRPYRALSQIQLKLSR
jgi:hypothetical protein